MQGQISGMVIGAVKLVNDGVPEGQISLKVVPEGFLQCIMQLRNAHSGTVSVGTNHIPSLDVGPGSQDFKVHQILLLSII